MIDRRQFLNSLAVIFAGGLMFPDQLVRSTMIGNGAAASLTTVIYDARIPASCVFARAAGQAGMSAIESGGDIGELWHKTIGPGLRLTPQRLMGLTLASDLFLLKLLAADVGMKIVQETPHDSSRSMVSWVIASGTAA